MELTREPAHLVGSMSSYSVLKSPLPNMEHIATAPVPSAFPMPQPGMPQPGMPQPGMPQPGMPQPGMPQPGMPQPEMPQPGMIQPGMPHTGLPMVAQGGWSPSSTTCPPGLEYLMALSNLFIQQKVELFEAFTGWETKNKYVALNIRGETVFYIAEESGCCARFCMGSSRSCKFYVYDINQREVLRMVRPYRFNSCCCPCYLQELEVYSGNTLLGSVTQNWTLWKPTFSVRDASGETVLIIKGPCFRFCIETLFKVKSADGVHRVGEIKKEWSGISREFFTDTDNFSINFPLDLDVKIKAVLLGACLLMDFMYFETSGKKVDV
ncbi:phospholipid scramblase 2 isoform X2 [Xylocopa sonorina]|uniref:phospholipid scramblase 2 isoform X2 n=1 Tax=Xylocopa sonorina TaxID=1818115 RepID=UPI00403AE3E6